MGHNARSVTKRLSDYGDEQDPDAFWEAIRPADEPLRHRWFLPAAAAVLAVSVPWYLPSSIGDRLVSGLPVWTWITIGCGLILAAITAFASLRLWRDGADREEDAADRQARSGGAGESP